MNNLIETIKKLLIDNKFFIMKEEEINGGVRFRLLNGAIINVYKKGKYCFQGKNIEKVLKLLRENIK
jgi:ribonuclease HIII